MSVVIAIKDNDKVYIGADSQSSCGVLKRILTNPNNYKIWKTKGLEHSIMGHVGLSRDNAVVKFKNFIPQERTLNENIDYEFVQGEMILDIYDKCNERGFVKNDDGPHLTSEYIFTHKDKIFTLERDLSVFEVDDYVAMGSGEDGAIGSLDVTINEPPVIRILKAVVAANNTDSGVDFPVIISDTESMEFKIYTKEDIKRILNMKALSRGGNRYV